MEQIILDYTESQPFYIQIYHYFKEEISKGNLKKDEKLPSIRALSNDIKVSKTTVESAYNQLVVEGYINNIPKKGYFVVELKDFEFNIKSKKEDKTYFSKVEEIKYINTGVDSHSFDFKVWKRLYTNVLMDQQLELTTGGSPQGEESLRKQIAEFVQTTRGIHCSKDQVIVGAGVQHLLGILCSLLRGKHENVAIEYPGFIEAKNIFEDYNMNIIPVPVYHEGMDVDSLKNTKTKMVYLSPSNQYPTGSVMPIDKRIEVLHWAKENNAIVIEDDYDCLIRYHSRPIPALQGLDDTGSVIYLGSFSKILLPSVRISYMILPQSILKLYMEKISRYNQTSSKIEQLTLGKYIEKGYLDKHLRKVKKVYHKKNEIIVDFIEKHAKEKINILGHDSGLHMVFEIKKHKNKEKIKRKARQANIYIEVIEDFLQDRLLVVFPFGGLDQDLLKSTMDNLVNNIF